MDNLINSKNNKTHQIEGSLNNLPYHDAPTCMLGEIITMVLDKISDANIIFPIQLYFIKPDRKTRIIETTHLVDEPFTLDSLFHCVDKKKYFNKRLDILHDCTRIKPFNQKWNKARLIIHDDQRYIFQYKFDRDIHWLYSRQLNGSIVVDKLSSDILKKINSWDGLEEVHPRPWEHAYF